MLLDSRSGARAGAFTRRASAGLRSTVVPSIGALLALLAACQDPAAPAISALAAVPRASASAAPAAGDVIPDEYIVTFKDDERDAPGLARQMVAQHGGTLRHTYTAALKGFAAHLPAHAVEGLRRNPLIARVERDALVDATEAQASPTWGLDRIDQRSLPLDRSYTYTFTGAGVTAYILDSGIRFDHAEFEGRAIRGTDVIGDGQNGADCRGHGRQWGVAKKVTLVSVRILDCNGSGTVSGAIAGLDWVARNRKLPAVANVSLGTSYNESLNAAVRGTIAAGVQVAIAAGNSNVDACTASPASTPEAVVVGAAGTADIDDRQPFSNWGSCVDVFAPGAAIMSAWITDPASGILRSGTSMASPHAAGVMALWLSENPALTPAQLQQLIVSNATPNVVADAKSVNAHMLQSVRSATAPTLSPSASFSASCSGLTCSFDASASRGGSASISRYDWAFGDGSAGGGVTGSRTYATGGSYTVTLTITNSQGATSQLSRAVSVNSANQAPVARFTASCQLLACTFADASSDVDGSIMAWSWSFGDGTGSTFRSPSHSLPTAGTYTVRLTVTDNAGATASASQSVTVSAAPPTAEFMYACTGTECRFTDGSTSASGIRQWSWSFGEGGTSTLQNPSYRYAAPGTYTARLDVVDDVGVRSSTSKVVTVSVGGISLSASPGKLKSQTAVTLAWSGATTAQVALQRNGVLLRTVGNSGAFTDTPVARGTWRYRVCETDSGTCSTEVTVQVR
jgi:PKD repeat protein